MAEKITFSVIKADVGGYVGHSSIHPELMKAAQQHLSSAVKQDLLIDGKVARFGDDLELIMTHRRGMDDAKVHESCWNVFLDCTKIAKRLKLYGAGQDLLGLDDMEYTTMPDLMKKLEGRWERSEEG